MQIFRLFSLVLFIPLQLFSNQLESNVLFLDETVQVTSEINTYENLVAGTPIQGSVMITHDSNNPVDANSFTMGDKPLKVQFAQSIPMSSSSKLVVSIYQFQLPGMKVGNYTLQPIMVKVGGKNYAAPPLIIQVVN